MGDRAMAVAEMQWQIIERSGDGWQNNVVPSGAISRWCELPRLPDGFQIIDV
jgi:hypothetical protein